MALEGRSIGGYELLAEIGRGGLGTVHRARARDGREVALKVLSAGATEEQLAAFERERRLLSVFGESEGFVPILDSGTNPPFLVMPLLEGGTLESRLARGPLPVAEAVRIAAHLAKALGHAHERGVVHRDVKPANVLFARGSKRPLLADLGLAKHFRRDVLDARESRSLTATGSIAGTPGYMAPEQIDDSKRVGPPADVFALGALLHEAIAGAKPFDSATILTYGSALATKEAPPLRRLRPGTPRWLEAVVLRALAKDPAARFADGHAFARALAEGSARARNRLVFIGAGVVAGVLLALLAIAGLRPSPPPPPPVVAPPRPVLAPPPNPPPRSGGGIGGGRELVDQARVANENGRHEDAEQLASKALDLAPEDGLAWRERGRARAGLRNLDGARSDLDRAVACAREDLDIRRTRLDFLLAMRLFDETREDMEILVAASPENLVLVLGRAQLREETDPAGAVQDYTRVLEEAPEHVEAFGRRARARARIPGQRADAIAEIRVFLEKWSDSPYAGQMRTILDELTAQGSE